MTWPAVGGLRRGPAVWARRAILALCVLALTVGSLRHVTLPGRAGNPRVVQLAIASLSAMATGIVYLRLAAVASVVGRRDLGRQLLAFGLAAAVVELVPLALPR